MTFTQLLAVLTPAMTWLIAAVAVIEAGLFLSLIAQCQRQGRRLRDAVQNMLKGVAEAPDVNSAQSLHDQLRVLHGFLETRLAEGGRSVEQIRRNMAHQAEKNALQEVYPIEARFNICSALVQVFPLLGILGTILALSQVTVTLGEQLKASDVTGAFVIAIDTTILGILFAVVFMVWEAAVQARVVRVVEDTRRANDLIVRMIT